MANHESYPNEAPRGSEKVLLAVEVMRAMQDLLSDEHEPHPDTWYTTWQELHDEVSQFSDRDRQYVINQIQSVYTTAMETLYPQLLSMKSTEEVMLFLSTVEVPDCDGSYALAQYTAENGNVRSMSLTMANLGKLGVSMYASIVDSDKGLVKSHDILCTVNDKMRGGVSVRLDAEEHEDEYLLRKIHPGQMSNLVQILQAKVPQYELDMKLAEIRIFSEDRMSESELDALIDYARERYHVELTNREVAAKAGVYDMSVDDLRWMLSAVAERARQTEE